MTGADVLLVGGPCDGERRHVNAHRQMITVDWELGPAVRDWDGTTVYVTRVGVASYRRTGPETFTHCRTPTVMGDHDFDLPEQQLPLEVRY